MQVTRPSLVRLFGYPSVGTSATLMHRLSSPCRFPLSFMASATTRWWPPALEQRVSRLMVPPNPPASRVFRLAYGPRNMATISRLKDDESGKPDRLLPISSADVINLPLNNIEERGKHETCEEIVKHTITEEDGSSTTEDHKSKIVVSDNEASHDEGYTVNNVLARSRHRDGSIYCLDTWWKKQYCTADRNETRLEAMALSDPTDCIVHDGSCIQHQPNGMLQILSLELAEISVNGGLVELYGYIAVRDNVDGLVNYVVNFSRDEPIFAKQGSLINMAGPKRGVHMMDLALIEYDMRIKTGEQEKDDLYLIDGASMIGMAGLWNNPFTMRIPGDYGAVNLTLARLDDAVEATIEVLISEVQNSFSLFLGCLTSGLNKEIQLFDGVVAKSCGLRRSVVAVVNDSSIDLKFKLGSLLSSFDQHCCSFNTKTHGHDTQEMETDFALISVKVTWSTLPLGTRGLYTW